MDNLLQTAVPASNGEAHFWRIERRRWAMFACVVVLGALVYAAASALAAPDNLFGTILNEIETRLLRPLYSVTAYRILTLEFILVLTGIFILQFLVPARPNEKTFSSHFFTDGFWFLNAAIVDFFVIATYFVWLVAVLRPIFDSAHLIAPDTWSMGFRFAILFIFMDFMNWLVHFLLHKNKFLWQFHAVHHSQTELNFFSDYRIHFLEKLLRLTFLAVPSIMLHAETPAFAAFLFFEQWYQRFYHSNLKLNLGPLKYILVTPQSHRYHHHRDFQLRDKNFGHFLTVWDWIFGTQATDWDSYPATGIDDATFPLEPDRLSIRVLWMPIVQQFHPFKVLAVEAWRRLSGR